MRSLPFAAFAVASTAIYSVALAQDATPTPAAVAAPAANVTASAPAASGETIEATDTERLRGAAGNEVVVVGVLSGSGSISGGGITFLNFKGVERGGFKAVVYSKSYPAFPEGFEKFMKQKVRLKGRIELYKSTSPQIIISSPDQIEIVQE